MFKANVAIFTPTKTCKIVLISVQRPGRSATISFDCRKALSFSELQKNAGNRINSRFYELKSVFIDSTDSDPSNWEYQPLKISAILRYPMADSNLSFMHPTFTLRYQYQFSEHLQ